MTLVNCAAVLPDKGADSVESRLKNLDLDVLWALRTGLHDLCTTCPSSDGLGSMMDFYEGGWQEVLPGGGPPSGAMAVAWDQHREMTTRPCEARAEVEANEPDHMALGLRVRLLRYPRVIRKVLRLRGERAVLAIGEVLTKRGGELVNTMWGHHPAVGVPFLSTACRFQAPGGIVRPPTDRTFAREATGAWLRVVTVEGRDARPHAHAGAGRAHGGVSLT